MNAVPPDLPPTCHPVLKQKQEIVQICKYKIHAQPLCHLKQSVLSCSAGLHPRGSKKRAAAKLPKQRGKALHKQKVSLQIPQKAATCKAVAAQASGMLVHARLLVCKPQPFPHYD